VAEAKIKITADTKSAERDIKSLDSALKSLDRVSGAAGKAFAGITAAGAGVAVAFKLITDQVGELADLGKVLDLSAQSLLNLQRSAQLAGVDAGELNQALFRLRGNLGDALVKGTGPAKEALDRLSLSARELSTIPADQQIAKITEALRQVQNPAERSALAIDLLGKQGPRLLEVADNAARLAAEAKAMGLALSDIEVRNLELAGDAIDELSFIAKDVLTKALAQLAPYVIALVESLKEAITESGGIGNIISNSVIPAVKLATQAAAAFALIFVGAKITAGAIAISVAVIRIYDALKVATTAAGMLNAVMGKNPIIKIVGAITTLAGALYVVKEVGDAFDALDAQAQAISANTQTNLQKENDARKENTEEAARLTTEQDKALKSLEETIQKIQAATQYERDRVALGEDQANINKIILEEQLKLEKVGLSLTDQQRERIQLAQEELIAAKEQAEIAKVIYDATRKQTELEKINRGLSLQKSLGGPAGTGFVTSEKEYQKDQDALQALLDNKIISEQQYFQQREELARQYNLKVQQLEMDRIQTVMMAEQRGLAVVLSERDKGIIQAVGQQERQRKIIQERIEFEKKSEVEKAQLAIQQGANIFSALGAQNKKAFEAAKAFNIANAIMNTYLGVTKALAVYPFPFNLVFAAGALAAGMAQVAQIRSQSYSGRALGGPVMGGQTYMVGESGPELFTPQGTGSITRNGDLMRGGQPVEVNFTIVANDTQGFDQLLSSRKGVIQQIISDAMLERGQRSTM
jgi:hypothetical protein